MQTALKRQKGSVQANDVARYEAYNKQHGSSLSLGHAFNSQSIMDALTLGTTGGVFGGPSAWPATCDLGKVSLTNLCLILHKAYLVRLSPQDCIATFLGSGVGHAMQAMI